MKVPRGGDGSSALKVLIYSHDFLPLVGGVQAVVKSLAQGLVARGTDVTVVTATPADGFDDNALSFRVVRRTKLGPLLRLVRESDVVHLAGPSFLPLFMGWLLRKPLVLEHHGFHAVCPNGQLVFALTNTPCPGHFMAGRHHKCLQCNAQMGKLKSFEMWFVTFFRRWLCRRVGVNITPTEWLQSVLQLPNCRTIYHGIPDESADTGEEWRSAPPQFAYVGRLVSAKGVGVFLEAAQRLKSEGLSFALRIIGDGPERSGLETQAASLGLRDGVKFLGHLQPAALDQELRKAAAVVMPSLGGEVFGLVAAENMVRGRLIIVSDIGALSEVVGNAGLVFPTGDSEGLAARLKQVMVAPGESRELRKRARERSTRLFNESRMIEEHLSLYRRLLNGESHPC